MTSTSTPLRDAIRGDVHNGYTVECNKPIEECAACTFHVRFTRAFPAAVTRPVLPRYIVEMFIEARVQAVMCTSSEIVRSEDCVDFHERGLVLAHYTEPLQIPHVKQYQYITKSILRRLVIDSKQNEAFCHMQKAVDECDRSTHFVFALLIGDIVAVHIIARQSDRQFMRAVHDVTKLSKVVIQTPASTDDSTHAPQTIKPFTLRDRLEIVRWCCQTHFLQDPRTTSQTVTSSEPCLIDHSGIGTQSQSTHQCS